MVSAIENPEDFEPTGPDELLDLLAGSGEQSASIDPEIAAGLARSLNDHLALVVDERPPASPGDRAQWLLGIERLDLARRAARRIGAGGVRWANETYRVLDAWIARLSKAVAGMDDAWSLGSLIEQRAGRPVADLLPWSKLLHGVEAEAPRTAEPARVIRAWVERRLSSRAEAWLTERVLEDGPRRDAYREHLAREAGRVRFVRYPQELSPEPFFRLRLPHLGRDACLEAAPGPDGTRWRWPGRGPIEVPDVQAELRLDGDEASGALTVRLEPIEPAPLQVARRLAERAGEIAEADEVDESVTVRLGDLMAAALAPGCAWREELERAVEVFSRGEEEDEDTEEWVHCALRARVGLDRAAFRTVNPPALKALRVLDASLAHIRDAVLLLDPEEYHDLVEGVEFPPGAWWARRRELDTAIPESIVTETLAGMEREPSGAQEEAEIEAADRLAEPAAEYRRGVDWGERARDKEVFDGRGIVDLFRAFFQKAGKDLTELGRLPALDDIPEPAIATGARSPLLAGGKGKKFDIEERDGLWKAFFRIDRRTKTGEMNVWFPELPGPAVSAILCGIARPIEREPGRMPRARFDLEEVIQAWERGDMRALAVVVPGDGEETFSMGEPVDPGEGGGA